MLWLFGQIWLWLLVAFLLGAVLTWAVLTLLRREGRQPAEDLPERMDDEPPPRFAEDPGPTAESQAEKTQLIPAARVDDYEQGDGYEDEPYEPAVTGHREGVLPRPPGEPEWRNEQTGAEGEPAWPRPEDLPASEHRPGRGG
ncbi:hypothetical protein [Amycolatopsis sp. H20-H5]|uniref:hypothetical protein n=1 Tax=Amycolatopsis sp. H20-H5 TaxID=3046309 RepID=UPI002DB96C4D|nr:hypothetical protein [Amycolatopsis sp. H20-H5]MEC3982278.1 hypothetical protein [Amycolatopsis sp. H20-H5]